MTLTDPQDEIASTLRGELHARAAHLGEPPAPFARLEAAARRDRIRRRSLGGCAGVALVAALATSITTINSVHHSVSLRTAAGYLGKSPLLNMAPRGNLVGDAAFMQAAATRLGPGKSILYANDDGKHTVVIGGAYQPAPPNHPVATDIFTVLVGPHGASAAELRSSGVVGTSADSAGDTFSYVGEFSGDGESVPYVVLGPADMTEVDIAPDIQLVARGGKLVAQHTDIDAVSTKDGAAAGELPGPSTKAAASHLGMYLAFRGELASGGYTEIDPGMRLVVALPGGDVDSPAYDALREAILAKGRTNGLTDLQFKGPGGDAVTDNAAQVVSDIAGLAGVDPSAVNVTVDWVGQETSEWDSVLLDIDVPGLPHIQAFVRGLAPGQPDDESPGLDQSFVRPAQALTAGHLPETAQAFGGTPELSTLGLEVAATW